MPNYCSNYVEVTGNKESIAKFKEDAKAVIEYPEQKYSDTYTEKAWTYKSDLSLSKLVPCEGNDWYNEHNNKWGTKWDVDATLEVDEPDKLCYNLESAWSPPIEAFTTISANYPLLEFKLSYDEPGCAFYGEATFIAGDVNDDEHEYAEGACSKCGEEQSIGPQGSDTECYECGAGVIPIKEYEALHKEKPDADTIGCDKYHARKDDELTDTIVEHTDNTGYDLRTLISGPGGIMIKDKEITNG